jgi:hypothetical protein
VKGTSTDSFDIAGNFVLGEVREVAILQILYWFATQEIPVAGKTSLKYFTWELSA